MKRPFSKIFGQGEKSSEIENWQQEQVIELSVKNIIPNRFQPRTVFNEAKIEELAQTIQSHGLIQPIVVRQYDEDRYEIIAGERRWRAATFLEWEAVPAIVKEYDDAQTAAVALIENLQREELTVIEEAMAYAKLMDIQGLTQEGLAHRLGKGQSTIANKLRLLKLPMVIQNGLLEKKITERHARALILLKAMPDKQEQLFNDIVEKELNVKQTEMQIKVLLEKTKKPKIPKRKMSLGKDMRIAVNTIRQSIGMVNDSGLQVDTNEEDLGDSYQFTIKITKK